MTDKFPENEILVCIARKTLNDDHLARLDSLLDGLTDWDYLCDKADQHRLLPLLYHHLNANSPQKVPAPILNSLKQSFIRNSQMCLYLFSELRRVLRLFEDNGITAAVFKGPVLAAAAYGDIGLRQTGDIDILVEVGAFSAAKKLLSSAGYQMEPALTAAQEASHLRFHCEIQFISADSANMVDLHWGLSPLTVPFRLDTRQVLARAVRVNIQGTSLLTFSREDMILYLAFHGSKHYWSRLEWISSLAEYIRDSETIDWNLLMARARDSRSMRMLQLGLMLAQDFGDVSLPASIFADAKELESLRSLAAEFKTQLLSREMAPPSALQTFRYNLELMDRKPDAVVGLLRSTFVPTISDWQALTLTGPLYRLYYVFRPFRLLKKYLSGTPSGERRNSSVANRTAGSE